MSHSHLFAKDFRQNIQAIIRVDYAGEMGAVNIYNAQLENSPNNTELLEEMLDCEIKHFEYFKGISKELHVPQTVFLPIWSFFAKAMGSITARSDGGSLPMLCTQAVETIIEEHYAHQIIILEDILKYHTQNDWYVIENKEKIQELLAKIKIFMEEEIEHKNTGEANSVMQKIPFHAMKLCTKIAVILSEKI